MRFRPLGRTGLNVSLLSYGSGGPSRMGQSQGYAFETQRALIHRCFDLGINLYDTAPVYDDSEAILGRILADFPRESYLVATKWKPHRNEDDAFKDPHELEESLERSLQRLRVDHIDIYQLHTIHAHNYLQDVERYYPVLDRLRAQGKIRCIGLTEDVFPDGAHATSRLALRAHPALWDTMMIKYGILNQYAAQESFPLAIEHGVGILNMSPVRVKLSRPDELRKTIADWKQRALIPHDCLPDDDPLGWLRTDGIESIVSAGYRFAADHPAISTVITGASTIEHLEANARALDAPPLPAPIHTRLTALFGHLAEGD